MQPNPMTTNKEGVQAMIHAKFDATTSKEGGVLIKHADVRAGSGGGRRRPAVGQDERAVEGTG
jgi:hypothetical protein